MNIAAYTKSHARILPKLHCRHLKTVSHHINYLRLYFRNNNNNNNNNNNYYNIFHSYKIIVTPLAQLTPLHKYCVNALEICYVYKEITKGSRINDNNTFTENEIYDAFVKYI
jgi:hypothetical protein